MRYKKVTIFFPNKIYFVLQMHCHGYKTSSTLTYKCTYTVINSVQKLIN